MRTVRILAYAAGLIALPLGAMFLVGSPTLGDNGRAYEMGLLLAGLAMIAWGAASIVGLTRESRP